jgi:hypothetical protein
LLRGDLKKVEGAFAMTFIRHALADSGLTSLLDSLRGYLVSYRLAFYLLSAAAVVVGCVLNWNWQTAAGSFRLLAVLPCALMMFSCVRPASSGGPPGSAIAGAAAALTASNNS